MERKGNLKRLIIIVLVAALIVWGIFTYIQKRQEEMKDVADRAILNTYDTFIYDGEVYGIGFDYDSWRTLYTVIYSSNDRNNCRFLSSASVQWSDAIERFVYVDGKKVKTCDFNVKNKETIFKASGYRITPRIVCIFDRYAVISPVYAGQRRTQGFVSIIDLITGDIYETEIPSVETLFPACIADGYLYYSTGDSSVSGIKDQLPDPYFSLRRCNIETGECEIISNEITENVESGCVINGNLYFMYTSGNGKVWKIPVTGGNVEEVLLDRNQYGIKGVDDILAYTGRLLIICNYQDDNGDYIAKVFSFDTSENEVSQLFSWNADYIASARIEGNTFISCYTYEEDHMIFCGTLN